MNNRHKYRTDSATCFAPTAAIIAGAEERSLLIFMIVRGRGPLPDEHKKGEIPPGRLEGERVLASSGDQDLTAAPAARTNAGPHEAPERACWCMYVPRERRTSTPSEPPPRPVPLWTV
jgi:hypothetical protein